MNSKEKQFSVARGASGNQLPVIFINLFATGAAVALSFLCPEAAVGFELVVPSNPLWTDTGVLLLGGETISITASGTWTTIEGGSDGLSGPDGRPLTGPLAGWSDGFLAGAPKGALLAYVGQDPYQGHWGDAAFFPHSDGYWVVGSSNQFSSATDGKLWLGFNDDARSTLVDDNAGSLTVNATVGPCIPHPARGIAMVVNGSVTNIQLTDRGCGYTNAPTIRIVGGGGVGATAQTVIQNGYVVGIDLLDGGIGYTNAPAVKIASPPFMPYLNIAVSRVKVSQHVVLGRNYVLESSSDLQNWSQVGDSFTAENELIEQEFDVAMTGRFFRVREVP